MFLDELKGIILNKEIEPWEIHVGNPGGQHRLCRSTLKEQTIKEAAEVWRRPGGGADQSGWRQPQQTRLAREQ